MNVRETISHGNYRNVREVELTDASPSNVARMLRDSPYAPARLTADMIRAASLALASGGSYSWGWVDWEVIRQSA